MTSQFIFKKVKYANLKKIVATIYVLKSGFRFNHLLVRWGTPGNCSNYDEILKNPRGINLEVKQWNILSLSKSYLLNKYNIRTNKVKENLKYQGVPTSPMKG